METWQQLCYHAMCFYTIYVCAIWYPPMQSYA